MKPERRRPVIHSHSNPQVKRVARLRNAAVRRKSGLFLIDGVREIELAAAHGFQIETVFYTEGSDQLETIPRAGNVGAALQPVTAAVLSRISYGQRTDAPVALAVTPALPLRELRSNSEGLWLVLDRTEKPGNLGACLRTATAVDVGAVILTDPVCEVFNPNTIRSSRGTVFALPMAISSSSELVTFCKERKIRLMCSRVDATRNLWECDFTAETALVFGNESVGLGENWLLAEAESFCIPMQGAADSLNLSISAAVTLYEAVRQRRNI